MDVKQLFLREAKLIEHYRAQTDQYAEYTGMLLLLLQQGVSLSHATKARVLAACWARRDFEIASYLLDHETWSLPEVVKALKYLDAGRQIRALQKRITRLTAQGSAKPSTIGQLRSTIQDLQKEEQLGSLSGALAKRLKRWINRIPKEKLSFYALSMPPEPWRELADLIHLRADDFQLDWFLPVVFGQDPPAESMAAACLNATQSDLPELINKWHAPYSFIRRSFTTPIREALRGRIAQYETLDTLLWYYEELACYEVDKHIHDRLTSGEAPTFGYGMLVERLLLFEKMGASFYKALVPIAERRLKEIKLPLESPVVVLGDASSSMNVAIRVSTIIGSMLATLTGAKIRFFNHELMSWDRKNSFQPTSLHDLMGIVKQVKASGMTSPAASLWPSLRNRELVKHFVIVTDEEENKVAPAKHKKDRLYFAPMLKRYREEVYPAKVTFISFLQDPQKPGHMTPQLKEKSIPFLQFTMNGLRPDLKKLDALLGLLASESTFFQEHALLLADEIHTHGLPHVLEQIDEKTKRDEKDILLAQLQRKTGKKEKWKKECK